MKIQRGFTLVELIVVIVLTGILASTVTIFFKPAVDAYFASQRRAALADMADTAVRRMAREIRAAVPNSVRDHGEQCIEFVPTIAGGRYRKALHMTVAGVSEEDSTTNCTNLAKSCSLDLSEPSGSQKTAFDVLQMSAARAPKAGDAVVIGNQQVEWVYEGKSRKLVSDPYIPGVSYGVGRIRLETGGFPSEISGYEFGRFFVVQDSASVAFVCSGSKLYRVVRALGTPTANTCPDVAVNTPVLADKVSHCRFVYSANDGTQQNGLAWLEITLSDAGEDVSMAFGVHVSNVP